MAEDGVPGMEWRASNGFIDHLEVDNFKSYRGRQVIGPFRPFTAVVGPNGSGKSNLMDAISFVLGVKTAQLRGSLKELLYVNSDGQEEGDRPRKGYVRLVYCTDEGEQVAFSRHIQPSSANDPDATTYQSVYRINDKQVGWEAYASKLSSFGILVKVRNFLVFQGDIEAVAAKSPSGLTTLFEQISGSEGFKQQYEELQGAAAKAEEKVAAAFARRKAVAADRKAKKEQADEAERYLAAQAQLRELRTEAALFSLACARAERDDYASKRTRLTAEAQKAESDHANFTAQEDTLKRAVAAAGKERELANKRAAKLQMDKDKKTPALVKAKEEQSRLVKRIKTGEKEVAELEGKAAEAAAKLAKLEKELKSVKKAKAKLEAEIEGHYAQHAAGAGGGLGAAEVQEEYARIKAQVAEKTAKLQSERDTLAAQLKSDEDELAGAEKAVDALRARVTSLRQQVDEAGRRSQEAAEAAAGAKKELRTLRAEVAHADETLRKNSSERETLDAKRRTLEDQLYDARSDRRESQKDKKMSEAVEALKRMYPGAVHGRLQELGKVTRREYNLALAVAMGRDVDSVVVDSERTAMDAIQYLRDQKVPPMTFIPLGTCKVQPIMERLRSLGGTARLAVDMVEPHAPGLERAFQYVFGNALVCESEEEAKRLAYGGGERHKVVSRNGTLFNRAGMITGGHVGDLATKASRWDDAEVDGLKRQLGEIEARLKELPTATELRQQHAVARERLSALEATIGYKELEAGAAKERSKKAAVDAEAAERDVTSRTPRLEALAARVEERRAALEALTARVNEVGDRLFRPFSQRLGLASIREYEEAHAAFEERASKERAELEAKETKLANQISYERSREVGVNVARKQAELDKDKARLAEVEAAVAAAQSALGDVDKAVAREVEAAHTAQIEVEKADADLKELRKRGASAGAERARIARAQAAADAAVEAAEARARDVVGQAELDQLPLPYKPGMAPPPVRASGGAVGGEDAGAEAMEVDGGAAGPSSGVAAASGGSVLDSLDFSGLRRPLAQAAQGSKPGERDALGKELASKVGELATDLAARAPNLKAPEQYEAVKEKEREMTVVLDGARQESAAAQEAFNRCRQGRYDAFTAAFEHIAREIDVIYKELTRSPVHPLGGTAYLSCELSDEPYLGGIKYVAMPPTKRFRDMEQLSGGEKTVAALALLFAIHSYRPSPFFVLDEVDAALDATNVARVAHYIRDKTRGASLGGNAAGEGEEEGAALTSHFQSIVISLKDIFYEKADALVGVARDGTTGASRTFTFDLSAFGEPAEAV